MPTQRRTKYLFKELIMAKFEIAYSLTAVNEGGYTNHQEDSGNWSGGKVGVGILVGTNLGISAPVLSKYLGRTAAVNDMKNLSVTVAMDIYKKNYWNAIRGDEINSQQKANSIYDSAVNMGVGTSIGLVQDTLKIPITKKMDTITLNALNK